MYVMYLKHFKKGWVFFSKLETRETKNLFTLNFPCAYVHGIQVSTKLVFTGHLRLRLVSSHTVHSFMRSIAETGRASAFKICAKHIAFLGIYVLFLMLLVCLLPLLFLIYWYTHRSVHGNITHILK